jgi:hypothetical protein
VPALRSGTPKISVPVNAWFRRFAPELRRFPFRSTLGAGVFRSGRRLGAVASLWRILSRQSPVHLHCVIVCRRIILTLQNMNLWQSFVIRKTTTKNCPVLNTDTNSDTATPIIIPIAIPRHQSDTNNNTNSDTNSARFL